MFFIPFLSCNTFFEEIPLQRAGYPSSIYSYAALEGTGQTEGPCSAGRSDGRGQDTSGKQGISPGSFGPSVPVAQPGLTNRD
jgi:hypothetical protein